MNTKDNTPALLLDLVKYRIRLQSSTLKALQNPKFVMLVINPKDMSLGVLGSNYNEKGAHRVVFHASQKYCELYSRSLLRELAKVYSFIKEGEKYKLQGQKIKGKNIVRFAIKLC